MGECKLDHPHEDVAKKLESQKSVLPADISEKLDRFLNDTHPQETLNTLFHLLKKYDLASSEEQQERNKKTADACELTAAFENGCPINDRTAV